MRLLGAAALVAIVGSVTAPPVSAAPSSAPLEIVVLSNRADLVSGGDALVEVRLPAGADPSSVRVAVDGKDVSSKFALRPTGRVQGLLTGLRVGANTVRAAVADGRGAQLTITNAPIGGPVFSGPHIQPWGCTPGGVDKECNRPPQYNYVYQRTSGGSLAAYNMASPPSDVAMTTTDTGETVPFIVRQEIGVLARDQYRIAALFDPKKAGTPWDPPAGVNSKLVITHGASCDTAYEMDAAPDVLVEPALAKGFIVMSHALDNAGHNCNIITQAESLVMTKEKVIEEFGPIRYTIGRGCSGGSLVQQQVANAYPGLYQGITPQCSFTDAWSSAQQYVDYQLLRAYFEHPDKWGLGVVWTPVQMMSAYGHPNVANPITFTEVISSGGDPSRPCPGVPAAQVYDAQTNPRGVRCSLQDYMVNVFGATADGKARRPADNVGIQYGLSGLLAGTMTAAEFVDLNTKIGAFDIDYNPQAARTVADPLALQRAYTSGAINTANNLDQVAIIDLRGPDPGAFHDVYRTYAMRARLLREHGTAANQVLWRGQAPLLGDATFADDAVFAMDRWLAAVEKDHRAVPLARKILDDKPASVADRCTNGAGVDVPGAVCDGTVQAYASPRIEAGAPIADDTMKCQLKPLRREDYPVALTDPQLAALRATFPTGVCDYSKPGVSKQGAIAWLTYNGAVGGRALGPAPVSAVATGSSVLGKAVLPATGRRSALAVGLVVMAVGLAIRRGGARVARRPRTTPR
ncbi:MAG TPA: DUF6351 family protein [Acidimicrobiales bacterium]|nr:DUF6351 family protein [Acidimicrobiales bacterium]